MQEQGEPDTVDTTNSVVVTGVDQRWSATGRTLRRRRLRRPIDARRSG